MSEISLPGSLAPNHIDVRQKIMPRAAQTGLVILLAVIYGGGFLFLVTISPLLLYGFYLATGILLVMRIESIAQLSRDIGPIVPYMAWLILFWCWGLLFSPYPGSVAGEVIRVLFRNLLFLIAVALTLTDRRSYRLFARLVLVAIFVNYFIAQRQISDPQFALDFARMLGEESYTANSVRPAGLWINPDEAAFALLFGLLVIARERGLLVWLGRAAAAYTIYLTASRSGNYILALCVGAYLLFKLWQHVQSFRRAAVLFNLLALLYAVGLGLYYTDNLPRYDIAQDAALSRILDFQESNTDYTRADLTDAVYRLTLNAPWHGYGAMGLQDAQTSRLYFQSALPGLGAHNIFLAIWGEVGLLGLAGYLAVLAFGISQVFRLPLSPQERLIASLMWAGYLIRGLTWHSQLINATGILIIGVLLCYPRLVALPGAVFEKPVDSREARMRGREAFASSHPRQEPPL